MLRPHGQLGGPPLQSKIFGLSLGVAVRPGRSSLTLVFLAVKCVNNSSTAYLPGSPWGLTDATWHQ